MKKLFGQKHRIAAILLSAISFLLPPVSSYASQPQAGKVYRLINGMYSTALTGNGPTASVTCSAVSDDYSQLWLVSSGATAGTLNLRNLNTGMYLSSSRGFSSPWKVTATPTAGNCDLIFTAINDKYSVRYHGDTYQCLHCDGQGIAVCWTADTESSRWTPEEVSMTQAQIDAALNSAQSNNVTDENVKQWQTALDAIFADKACTKLNSKYAAMSTSSLNADASYRALPDALRQMVTKVKGGDWSETDPVNNNKWDSAHALKLRVQNYEPYSRGSEAASMLGIQAYTNMNNPTGILGQKRQTLYVMVDKAPAEGSTLYINGAIGSGMFNEWNSGTPLKEGLNVITQWDDKSAQYIYYTVNTYDPNSRRRLNKLTDFEDIKIHIEGGSLNGIFDPKGDALYTPDTNEDWLYYRERATHDMFDLVGQYTILHFFFDKVMTKATGGYLTDGLKQILAPDKKFDLPAIMTAWDDFCFAERLLLGAQSADDIKSARAKGYFEPFNDNDVCPNDLHLYFNNRMMGITMQGDLFMNATSWRTAYNPSTMSTILLDLPNDSGALWGPAHEYGHMNQAPMKFAGTTEISNNVFSNVAIFYQGITTSRADYPSSQRSIFNKGLTYLEHGTWGTTRMFWQLFLYYHVQGHNRKFYPTLYELLRQNPLQQSYELNSRYDMLHFAKMCCLAAGEDLTDFFTAWGFFIPLKDYFIDDYSQFNANLTQADINLVKAEIADYKLPKSRAILFIDDRPGSDRKTHSEFDKNLCGRLGGLKDFKAGTTPDGKHLFNLNGTDIEVTGGTGGVGFLALDNATDELLTFANDYSWEMTGQAAASLATGSATLYAVAADGKLTKVPNAVNAGTAEQKKAAVDAILDACRKLIGKQDQTMTKVGWYRGDKLTTLSALCEQATEIAASDPEKAYNLVAGEYYRLILDPFARVSYMAGNSYRIVNRQYGSRALSANGDKTASQAINFNNKTQSWTLEDAGNNQYYLRNASTGQYIQAVNRSTAVNLGSTQVPFTIVEIEPGYYAFASEGDKSKCLHIDQQDNVVGWSDSEAPSQWVMLLTESDERNDALYKLRELVSMTESLLEQAGTVEFSDSPIKLGASNMKTNAYCRVNGADQFNRWDVLFDGKTNTYFHSDYSPKGSDDGLDHWLQVDLGEGNELNSISFSYTTRATDPAHAPQNIKVFSSNDGEQWATIATIISGLPSSTNTVYKSDPMQAVEPSRYFRFMVTATYSNQLSQDGHPYFVMSEFSLNKTELTCTTSPKYPNVTDRILLNAYTSAKAGATVADDESASTSDLAEAYSALMLDYKALADAMDLTGLDETTVADNEGPAIIHDLYGRRISQITTPGIYIINGRKMLIR